MPESIPSPTSPSSLPDTGNSIGVLRRREIEARIVAPLLDALGAEFGREAVLRVARETVIRIAREQGAQLAVQVGGDDLIILTNTHDILNNRQLIQCCDYVREVSL